MRTPRYLLLLSLLSFAGPCTISLAEESEAVSTPVLDTEENQHVDVASDARTATGVKSVVEDGVSVDVPDTEVAAVKETAGENDDEEVLRPNVDVQQGGHPDEDKATTQVGVEVEAAGTTDEEEGEAETSNNNDGSKSDESSLPAEELPADLVEIDTPSTQAAAAAAETEVHAGLAKETEGGNVNANAEEAADRQDEKKIQSGNASDIGVANEDETKPAEGNGHGSYDDSHHREGVDGEHGAEEGAEDGERERDGENGGRRKGDGFIDGWKARGGVKGALRSYDRLLKEHYLKMSFVQATALGVVGDTIAQKLERRWYPGQRFDLTRSAHAGVLNMVIDGLFTPRWYNLLEHVSEERTLPVALVKAIAASAVYSPFANGLFLAGARALRYGPKARFEWAEWRRQLMVCTMRDFEMWPPLHILSFWLLPKHWRPLTSHLAGVALLVVISSTGLTDAGLPLGQRALPLLMRWARDVGKIVAERVRRKDRRTTELPSSQ